MYLFDFVKQKQNFFIFLLALTPILITGILVGQNSVNIPWVDQWNTPGNFFIGKYEGTLTNDYWISQHNESRLLVYRLLSIPLAYLTNWDVRYEVAITFLVACGISVGLFYLIDISCKSSKKVNLLLWLLINLLVFSPIQLDITGNWLMGIQMIMFVVVLCIVLSVLACLSGLSTKNKFILCAILCLFSTYSFANGLLSWIVVFPSLLICSSSSWSDILNKKTLIISWLACFFLTFYLYTRNFIKPHFASDSKLAWEHPVHFLQMFFSLLGAPLGARNTTISQSFGGLLFFTFISFLIFLFVCRNNFSLIQRSVGWFSLGLYSLLSAALISYGRLDHGLGASLFAKYTTATLYFTVSLIGLGHILVSQLSDNKYHHYPRIFYKTFKYFLIFTISLGLLLHVYSFPQSVKAMKHQRLHFLAGKACLLFTDVLENDACLEKYVYPLIVVDQWNSIEYVKKAVRIFDTMNLISPNLINSSHVDKIRSQSTQIDFGGEFTNLSKLDNRQYIAEGFLTTQLNANYGGVVLTYTSKSQQSSQVFTLADIDFSDGVNLFQSWVTLKWQAKFDLAHLPQESLEITAWAINSNTAQITQIEQAKANFYIKRTD